MRIVITGANGLLGGAFMSLRNGYIAQGFSSSDFDLRDLSSTLRVIIDSKPDVIIHCAAKTDVDWCEKYKIEAEEVNVEGTINILKAAKKVKAKVVFISSTGVYGTFKSCAYTEKDLTKPSTWHHKTKLKAESYVQKYDLPNLIIRTGWLYGSFNAKTDFVLDRLGDANMADFLPSNADQVGNPTYTESLVEQILLLIRIKKIGVFNCVNSAIGVSRYDYTKKVLALAGRATKVRPVPEVFFKRVAPVSNNESAINEKLLLEKQNIMPPWDLALEKYIKERLAL